MVLRALFAVLLVSWVSVAEEEAKWEWAGWGGGGYYYSAVFHPTRDGVIYLGGDVAGVYKSEDHGQSWRLINRGLADYGVFSLAVDRTAPDTVYAATAGGLCKSTDGGAQWRLLPNTGRKGLRITGEKNRSIRSIAVDPTDGQIVYAASPAGKVYKSTDGGETWQAVYEKADPDERANAVRVQFGKVNSEWCGGFWLPLAFPKELADCSGFGLTFKADGTLTRETYLTLKTSDGKAYRSRNLRDLFGQKEWGDVVLANADFGFDSDYAKKHPEETYAGVSWSTVNRLDLACIGPLMNEAPVAWFSRLYFTAADGTPQVVKEFAKNTTLPKYGNIRTGSLQGGPVYSVAVADQDAALVVAATDDAGVIVSRDGGATWTEAGTPAKASSVAVAASNPSILYGTFFKSGVWTSTDRGATWRDVSAGLPKDCSLTEVAVSPADPQTIYVIGAVGWNGAFFLSRDGGTTWTRINQLKPDTLANPTMPEETKGTVTMSTPKNVAVNPQNPQELYVAANWRPWYSQDGGKTWSERVQGADISCVYDLRFLNGRTFAAVMDEGVLVSEDDGRQWHALWPGRYDPQLSGHNWRLAVSGEKGQEHIVATCSPWDTSHPGRVVISDDGGKTYSRSGEGLPAKVPTANTMWGTGYPRALAADPRDPNTLYLGIDGDPSSGKEGGGVFKSADGGKTWQALPAQPGSRRMFLGLAVDPTDSQRLFWGACGNGGGLYRSNDGGASWQRVFQKDQWIFNVHVAADGTVYCPGKNLWRSTDHGETWRAITKLPDSSRLIVAVETDPADPNRLWFATTCWSGTADGGVYETTDGGKTWHEITGDLPYRKPLVLRYNPATHELWSAGVCLYKVRR